LVFEVLLNATSLFNHANLALPAWLDSALRLVLVTPDMHRVHHSEVPAETDSDFGFCLSCWDRLFGTYCAVPAAGQLGMVIGVAEFRADQEQRLDRLLTQPFRETA
jgi:sterol desaturase/sphingolipid hydroxylase (fatty acid hydroxylase superfamily)